MLDPFENISEEQNQSSRKSGNSIKELEYKHDNLSTFNDNSNQSTKLNSKLYSTNNTHILSRLTSENMGNIVDD
jgi:hypothetical protein